MAKTRVISINLTDKMIRALDQIAGRRLSSRSQVARELLAEAIYVVQMNAAAEGPGPWPLYGKVTKYRKEEEPEVRNPDGAVRPATAFADQSLDWEMPSDD